MAKQWYVDSYTDDNPSAEGAYVTAFENLPIHAGAFQTDADGLPMWPAAVIGKVAAGDSVYYNYTRKLSLEDGTKVLIAQLPSGGWIAVTYFDEDGQASPYAGYGEAGEAEWEKIKAGQAAKPTPPKSKAYVSKKTGQPVDAGTHTVELASRSAAAILIPLGIAAAAAWYWTRDKKRTA